MTADAKPRRRRVTGAGARVGGDHISLHVIAIIGTVATAASSWTISFTSLLAVAVWQSYPDVIHFMTAIEIDAPIIVFNVATIVFRHREQREAEWGARIVAIIMTFVSAGANFLHTVSVNGLATYQGWIGASFNALAPVLVFVCAEILGLLITRPKAKHSPVARARAETAKARAQLRELKKTSGAVPRQPRTTAGTDAQPVLRGIDNLTELSTGAIAGKPASASAE